MIAVSIEHAGDRVKRLPLSDLEGRERARQQRTPDRIDASEEAERIVANEAHTFRSKMEEQTSVPMVMTLRTRLDEICRQEPEAFVRKPGPFTRLFHLESPRRSLAGARSKLEEAAQWKQTAIGINY